MTQKHFLIAFLAFCMCTYGLKVWSAEPQSSEGNNTQKTDSKKADQGKGSPESIGAAHADSEPKLDPAEQQYNPYTDKTYRAYLWATVIGVFGGVVGIVFLVVQTFATKKAASAAKASADAALKNAQAIVNAERPWMFIEITTHALTHRRPGEPPESISFSVKFINYGKTPAEIVGFDQHPDCRANTDDLPTPPEYSLEGHVLAHTRMIPPGKAFEPPGEPSFVPSTFLVDDQWKNIRNSRQRLVYWGRLQYRDLIEDARSIHEVGKGAKIHDTCFCYFWSPRLNEFLITGPFGYNKHT